ncbi:hypothetical protein PLESTB_000900600 [Pleodorina starrii]|uniref:Uncharacterized protein n=1 Tax=Pleodorina starrii TaxID=330485 RepID=A0A9W6F3R3_9CHLO|nr:hypothetical protein PLESTM_001563300 [Pleodorina starrii]GLC54735.1 hypothetical protein PLESTB_000900600 [Pleodorina starrii]
MDEHNFLALCLVRHPELTEMLLRPVPVHCKDYKVCLQAATAFRPDMASSSICRASPSPSSVPRKLSIKSRIEGSAYSRLEGGAQPTKPQQPQQPARSTSTLVAAQQQGSDTEATGAAAYARTTADEGDEYTSDEDPADDSAVDAMCDMQDAELAAALAILTKDITEDAHAYTAGTPSRSATCDGVLRRTSSRTSATDDDVPPVHNSTPRRVRSIDIPCGIDLSGGDDGEDDDSGTGGGSDEHSEHGRYGSGPYGHPADRGLIASPSFRDMARGWARRPTLEALSGLRLDGIAVRPASPVSCGGQSPSTGFGSRATTGGGGACGGGREQQRPEGPGGAAAAAPLRRRRAGSHNDALAPPPPLLLLPACLPRRLARTPDPGLRRGVQGHGWEGAADSELPDTAERSLRFGIQALPDPLIIDERHLRNCHSTGAQSFLPSSRSKHIAKRLQHLQTQLSRFSPSPETLPGDETSEAEAAEGNAGASPCEGCTSPFTRTASSPARMMLLVPSLPTSPVLSLPTSPDEGEEHGDEGPAGGGAAAPEAPAPPAATTPPTLQRRSAVVSELQLQLPQAGGGGGSGGTSPRLRGVSSTAPGGSAGLGNGSGDGVVAALSVRALVVVAAATTGDGAGSSGPQRTSHSHVHSHSQSPAHSAYLVVGDLEAGGGGSSSGGAAAVVALGNRQTMQLPVRQPQPPLLPYGGIMRLAAAASHGGGGVAFAGAHQRVSPSSIGRQTTQGCLRSGNGAPPRGGGGSGGGGGGGGGPPQLSAGRGVLVLRSMQGGDPKALTALQAQGGGSPGSGGGGGPASLALAPERSAARVTTPATAAAAAVAGLLSPRLPRCSDSEAALRHDAPVAGGGGGGITTPGYVAVGGECAPAPASGRVTPHSQQHVSLADLLSGTVSGGSEGEGGGLRLGVLGNCRPEPSTAAPPLLPSLMHQRGLRGSHVSPTRQQRHVLPSPQSGPLVKQEHRRSYTGVPAPDGSGGGGGCNAVAVVLAVTDGSGLTAEARQCKRLVGFATSVAAPSVSAAARLSGETTPGKAPGGLLPVITHQTSIRPGAAKLSPGSSVPFPTFSQQQQQQ